MPEPNQHRRLLYNPWRLQQPPSSIRIYTHRRQRKGPFLLCGVERPNAEGRPQRHLVPKRGLPLPARPSITNDITIFRPLPLHLSWIGSDHCIIAGTIQSLVPGSHSYTTPDYTFWEEYAEKEPSYTPVHVGDAYQHILDLHLSHCLHKTASNHSKKWWNQDIAHQLHLTRQTRGGHGYREASSELRRMIRRPNDTHGHSSYNSRGTAHHGR